ncbi:hypothetical protein CRUP_032062 [Coryphaenoides rupestris]|nr:hypothetical protein CRUP_032062 [Coryphaenoides rupestris]
MDSMIVPDCNACSLDFRESLDDVTAVVQNSHRSHKESRLTMWFPLLFPLLLSSAIAADTADSALPRLGDLKAAEAFIDSAEVVVVGFFESEESRGYKELTAVGLFNSDVKTHLLLFVNRGTKEFTELKEQLAGLAPEFTGKLLFVLINGAVKSNFRSLGYFGLKSGDPPRVGIYDGQSDMKWLLPRGRGVSSETVRGFCQAFLNGELKLCPGKRYNAPSSSSSSTKQQQAAAASTKQAAAAPASKQPAPSSSSSTKRAAAGIGSETWLSVHYGGLGRWAGSVSARPRPALRRRRPGNSPWLGMRCKEI